MWRLLPDMLAAAVAQDHLLTNTTDPVSQGIVGVVLVAMFVTLAAAAFLFVIVRMLDRRRVTAVPAINPR